MVSSKLVSACEAVGSESLLWEIIAKPEYTFMCRVKLKFWPSLDKFLCVDLYFIANRF